jgi:hypothetical protein
VYPRFVRRAVCPKCGVVKPPQLVGELHIHQNRKTTPFVARMTRVPLYPVQPPGLWVLILTEAAEAAGLRTRCRKNPDVDLAATSLTRSPGWTNTGEAACSCPTSCYRWWRWREDGASND